MNCHDVRSLLPDHLKGAPLEPGAQAHLETCRACRTEFQDLLGLWGALGRLEAPAPGPGLREKVLPRRRRGPALLLATAASLLFGMGGLLLGRAYRDPVVARPRDRNQAPLEMVRSPSPAERVKGLALLGGGDDDLVDTLLSLVEHDPDTRVRLAAVDSLYLSAGNPDLRQRVGDALLKVDRPEVQIALVDLIVGLRERQAVRALKRLEAEGRLTPEVRGRVASGIRKLESNPI